MKGGHGDNYYYQLAANVRRYKGIAAIPEGFEPQVDRSRWGLRNAGRTSRPSSSTTRATRALAISTARAGRTTSTDRAATTWWLARSPGTQRHVFFYARTRADLTPRTGPNWMELLIDADRDPRTGWEGFDFIINRTVEADGTTWLERNAGGWRWEKVAKVRVRVSGTELHLAIPRTAIGLREGDGGLAIDFKWTDNVQHPGDILDFYVSGDVAPEGRYKFRYVAD